MTEDHDNNEPYDWDIKNLEYEWTEAMMKKIGKEDPESDIKKSLTDRQADFVAWAVVAVILWVAVVAMVWVTKQLLF